MYWHATLLRQLLVLTGWQQPVSIWWGGAQSMAAAPASMGV